MRLRNLKPDYRVVWMVCYTKGGKNYGDEYNVRATAYAVAAALKSQEGIFDVDVEPKYRKEGEENHVGIRNGDEPASPKRHQSLRIAGACYPPTEPTE